MTNQKVKIDRINSDTLYSSPGISKVVTVENGKLVQLSGMVALDAASNLIGEGDLKAQAAQAYENIRLALELIGATPADVIMQRVYVVGLKPENRPTIIDAMANFYGRSPRPASALLGLSGLAREGMLIEIEVTAAIDA